MRWDPPFWIGNRLFTQADLDLIRWTSDRFTGLSRMELAFTICENLPWTAPNGQLRVHECLPLLEQLAEAGLIKVPAKRAHAVYRPARMRAEPLPATEVVAGLGEVRPVTVDLVPADEQAVWDATMAKYHALGYRRAFGAHQRYWIRGEVAGRRVVVGALLFAAAARNVAVRDVWLGWTRQEQQRFRYRVVANSRMLILPGVQVPHLCSHALALALRRLPEDWQQRYGYRPVVVETFVVPPWRGTCYRAANWLHLGQTTGLGRQDRRYAQGGTVREVFVYPLVRNWRQALVAEETSPGQEQADARQGAQLAAGTGGDGMITAEQKLNEMSEERIKQRYEALAPFLDERQRRLLVAAEAATYGSGGLTRVARLLRISTATVSRGLQELKDPETAQTDRIRRPGGGRKRNAELDPALRTDLERLVDPVTRGEPGSPLRWTSKSLRKLTVELNGMGHIASVHVVRDLLREMGYSLQANRKTLEGGDHPDRDAQFQHISQTVQEFQAQGQPVVSVDTKKKELVGQYKNAGQEWQPEKQPEQVKVHDFVDRELGKVAPYGVYDITHDAAWVSVGTDHDTAAFAVATIRTWWQSMGRTAYPAANRLLVTADGGGSNGARNRLWKVELQSLADATGLDITVCHFPPGTSKWNKIEHRLFSRITQNWRGRPLVSHEVVVNLIANTTTAKGLKVQTSLDTNIYPTGIKVSDEEMADVNLSPDDFHGDWNYTIHPHQSKSG